MLGEGAGVFSYLWVLGLVRNLDMIVASDLRYYVSRLNAHGTSIL